MTPLIHLIAYNQWFQTRKEAIKAETRKACEDSMTTIYAGDEATTPEAAIDLVSDHLKSIADVILKWLADTFGDTEENQQVLDAMKKRQKSCRVDESSYKLVDSHRGRLLLEGKPPA